MNYIDDLEGEARIDRHLHDERWPCEYGDAEADAMTPITVKPTPADERLIAECFAPFYRDFEKPGADEDYREVEAQDRVDGGWRYDEEAA